MLRSAAAFAGLLCFLIAPSSADGEGDWFAIGESTDGQRCEYNLRRTTFPGQRRVRTWTRCTYDKGVRLDSGATVKHVVSQTLIFCVDQLVANHGTYYYAERDKKKLVRSDPTLWAPVAPPPDSLGEALISMMCADSRAQ